MTFHVEPLTRYETEQGCCVETRRQTNAHGLEIEHVSVEGPARICDEDDVDDV